MPSYRMSLPARLYFTVQADTDTEALLKAEKVRVRNTEGLLIPWMDAGRYGRVAPSPRKPGELAEIESVQD